VPASVQHRDIDGRADLSGLVFCGFDKEPGLLRGNVYATLLL
jgi:hypothetical protein